MAVTTDTIQLNVEVITDEGRNVAKANVATRKLVKELEKTVKAGGDVADVLRRINETGAKIQEIDLGRVARNDLIQRSRQLGRILGNIPKSAPQYEKLNAEFKRINDRLATIRQEGRGVADAFERERSGGLLGSLKRVQIAALAAFGALAGIVGSFRDIIRATSLYQTFGKVLERELGTRSAAQKAIRDITKLADDLGKPADELVGSYTKLVTRGIRPTTQELQKLVDLSASQGKEIDQLAEALLDAGTLEFERLKEFGIRARQSGDQVQLSFKGQTVEVAKTQDAILNAILGFGDLQGVQGSAADSADNLGGKVSRLTGFFDRLLANLGQGGLGDAIGDLFDNAADLLSIFVDLTEVQQGLTTETRATQAAFNLEIETLRRGNLSADTRAELIERINTRYGDYLPNLLTEESTLGDIARAQELANRQFEQRIVLLAAEEQLTEVSQRRLQAKQQEIELDLELTAARERTIDAENRAFNANNTQNFAGVSTARGVAGDAAANDLAAQALDRLNANKEEQIQLEKEFQQTLKAAKDLGLDVESVLNPPTSSIGGGGDPVKKTLSGRIKAIEENADRQRALAERAFIQEEATEQEYNARLSAIREESFRSQLEAYAAFGQQRVSAAEELQNELIALERRQVEAPTLIVEAIGTRENTGVERDTGDQLDALAEEEARLAELNQELRNDQLLNEEQFAFAKLNLRRNVLEEEIAILSEGNAREVALAQQKKEELAGVDQELFDRRRDLSEREVAFQEEIQQQSLAVAQDGLGVLVDLLGQDEKARKKNSAAIKAFQTGQAILNGISEVTAIRLATAKQAASVALIPGAPLAVKIKGAVETGIAIAKTAVNVQKIAATKFGRGGTMFGRFGGKPHSQGGTKGFFDDGTRVEVEKDETFVIVNKNDRGLLSFLSQRNVATGGVPFFQRGGIALNAPALTPQVSATALTPAATVDNTELIARLDTLTEVTATMQTRLRSEIVLTDLESAAGDLDSVRALAEI